MGKEEMPVVPGPEEWDPNTEQKLIDKLYDRDMDFESDERSLELSRALGFPSVEAAKIYKKMASPFYNIENKEFSKEQEFLEAKGFKGVVAHIIGKNSEPSNGRFGFSRGLGLE